MMSMNQIEEKYRKIREVQRKKKMYTVAGVIFYIGSIVAVFAWYDWKLFVILTAFVAANNLLIEANKL